MMSHTDELRREIVSKKACGIILVAFCTFGISADGQDTEREQQKLEDGESSSRSLDPEDKSMDAKEPRPVSNHLNSDYVHPTSEELMGEIGPEDPGENLEVDLEISSSRLRPVVGQLWSTFGKITNRSESPIWIIDRTTTLNVAPEVWGSLSSGGSIGGFFPTIRSRPTDEIVRIEPGRSYTVTWRIDPSRSSPRNSSGNESENWGQVMSRIYYALRNFLFFQPGDYPFTGIVHVWSASPEFTDGFVSNMGSSFTLDRTEIIFVDASPWVLISGAVVGGLVCFALRILYQLGGSSLKTLGGLRYLLLGPWIAVLLCSIGTILIARLAATEFIISVQVNDVWGAIATGFALQWLGLSYVSDKLETLLSDKGDKIDNGHTYGTRSEDETDLSAIDDTKA